MKINPNHKITFIENPYPVWVIDNLLDGNLVDEIKKYSDFMILAIVLSVVMSICAGFSRRCA